MSTCQPTAAKACVGSVERAFAILEFLNSTRRGWNISEISRKLQIPKSTTHILVSTLDQLGYIRQFESSRRFQLTPKILEIGRNALKCNPLPQLALSHLHWLVQETKLTAHLGIVHENRVVFVQKVEGPGVIKIDTYIGKCSDFHCTGVGKAILAFQPQDKLDSLLSTHTFDRFTKKTITSKVAFVAELARVKQSGYSVDDEEEELGVRCVAAPVLLDGTALAAVSVTGTAAQIRTESMDRMISLTKSVAGRISASLPRDLASLDGQVPQLTA
jgi:IclR family transcriptional regulator, KDG regulon repressor